MSDFTQPLKTIDPMEYHVPFPRMESPTVIRRYELSHFGVHLSAEKLEEKYKGLGQALEDSDRGRELRKWLLENQGIISHEILIDNQSELNEKYVSELETYDERRDKRQQEYKQAVLEATGVDDHLKADLIWEKACWMSENCTDYDPFEEIYLFEWTPEQWINYLGEILV